MSLKNNIYYLYKKFKISRKRKILLLLFLTFFIYFLFCLPSTLFKAPHSTILLSKEGKLLNAKIADDGQWRFPDVEKTPQKFKDAIIAFEDHNFYTHWGVSVKAIGRAIKENYTAKKIVSGGSTITMQIARLSRGGKRNFWNKLIEAIWALRLEFKYSKKELLNIYASHAPFGGNIVGIEAAAWRYYGQAPEDLSWSQMATLAVLPNSPSLVRPGKNQEILLQKRNKVLKTLLNYGKIDEVTYELSLEEPLIGPPKKLPSFAPHLIQKAIQEGKKGSRIHTTLLYQRQVEFSELMQRHQKNLNQNFIHNASLLIIDVKSNEVITYIGNTAETNHHQKYVDIIQAPRSTGSILKPFLYSAMMQEGMIHNQQLIPDIPMYFDQFSPQNYDKSYKGAISVAEALSQSLNVPAVYLLKQYGVEKFLQLLHALGQNKINKNADYYGLSLILGGAESSLWDIANAYAGMVKTLNYYNQTNLYNPTTWNTIQLYQTQLSKIDEKDMKTSSRIDAGAIYEVFEILLEVNRPYMESSWKKFSSSHRIAWKTGTSYGNRDAWAVGCTPDYVVAVWAGNATGEGRPSIIGTTTAGAIMFDIFSRLKKSKKWFNMPYDELEKIGICKESGHRSTLDCVKVDSVWAHRNVEREDACHFHRTILTDLDENYRYYQNCTQGKRTKTVSWFELPPLQAYFYKKNHPEYKLIPPIHPDCSSTLEENFSIIYPKYNNKIIGTVGLDGKKKPIVFEASSIRANETLFWHVDNEYLGETSGSHTIKYFPTPGKHVLSVLDSNGNQKKILFEILQ